MGRPSRIPNLASVQEYNASLSDLDFWGPYVSYILKRHDLFNSGFEISPGVGSTYPTFICNDVVVKLFGYVHTWRESFANERAVQGLLATDPTIAVPKLVAEGQLFDDGVAPWPYLVTTRMSGVPWSIAGLSVEQRRTVAADLGSQIRRVHALRPSGIPSYADWPNLNVREAAKQSSLPPHLISQIDDFITRIAPFGSVFVHADVTDRHVFVENGRLAGIIDWGDAIVADRHHEIIQIYRALFNCDKELLLGFLEASDWPVSKDFPRQALGHGLYRQAIGLSQHLSMDVFEPIAAKFPLQDIGTLDELANELFAI